MPELTHLSIADAHRGLTDKSFSSVELVNAHLAEIKKQSHLNAYTDITEGIAFAAANASDDRRQTNALIGPMDGIPVAVKDLFCTKNVRSTSCSHILDGFIPPYESTVTANLFNAGAVMLGKTNMDEFAMGSTTTTSYNGPTLNPHLGKDDTKELVPGGSSGGSAAAVSAYLCMGALGSDTGGSVRQPAAFCGNVGVKPTYGRCSRFGMIAFASSLDQAGIFTRTVEDAAIMLQSICGHDPMDSTSATQPVPDFTSLINHPLKGKRIGIPKEYTQDGMPDEITKLWEQGAKWLQEAGAEIIDISLPHTKYALPVYYIIAPAEASSNLARYDGVRYGLRVAPKGCSLDDMYELTRSEGFGEEVKRRIMIGTYVLSAGYYDAYYKKAQSVRTLIAQDFTSAFNKVDAILTPTTPTPAFGLNEKLDPLTMYLNDVFTVPASLAGLPGMSVPVGISSNGLPLGLQVLSNTFNECTMFQVARCLEQSANYQLTPRGLK